MPAGKAAFNQSPGAYERLEGLIPPTLARLPELARNLWWSWHPEAAALFEVLNPPGVEPAHGNPILLPS